MQEASSSISAVKVAMVGVGYFARFQLNAWFRLPGCKVVAISEKDDERRAQLENEFPHLPTYRDVDALLSRHEIDVLDVATPPNTHVQIISPLLGRVKTIVCQKPFCGTFTAGRELTAAAKASKTELIVHENFRFMPWYRVVKKAIDEGELGKIQQCRFALRPGDGAGEDAYLARQPYFRDMKQFLIHETGVHWIDVFRYLFGEPETVFADLWRSNPAIKGEDSGLMILKWSDGLRAVLDGNLTLDHAADNHRLTMGEMIVEGRQGTLTVNGWGQVHLRAKGSNELKSIAYDFQDRDFGGDCVYLFQAHVLQHLIEDAPVETLAENYLKNLLIEDACYRSASEGRQIDI